MFSRLLQNDVLLDSWSSLLCGVVDSYVLLVTGTGDEHYFEHSAAMLCDAS